MTNNPTTPPRTRRPPADILDAGPPADDEAEAAVIASVLIDPRLIDDVAPLLDPHDFRCIDLRMIFEAMLSLKASGKPCDATLVVGVLRDAGQLQLDHTGDPGQGPTIGRIKRLLDDLLPSAAHAGHYAGRVREVSRRRSAYYRGVRLLGAVQRTGVRF
jgi:replicative DNA helicase